MSKIKRYYESIWSLQSSKPLDITDPADNGEDGSPMPEKIPDEVYHEAAAAALSNEALLHEITSRGFVIDWEASQAFIEIIGQLDDLRRTLDKMIKRTSKGKKR